MLPGNSMMGRQDGFSMLEILVALVIIATALLGTASLQINAMRNSSSSQFRNLAVLLGADMAERIEANKEAAVSGNYAVAATSAVSAAGIDCGLNPCNPFSMAAWDISQWESALTASGLPQVNWSVVQTVAGNPSTYRITINWTDRSSDKNARSETFSYFATRVVGN